VGAGEENQPADRVQNQKIPGFSGLITKRARIFWRSGTYTINRFPFIMNRKMQDKAAKAAKD
jgi:hypothetical protein